MCPRVRPCVPRVCPGLPAPPGVFLPIRCVPCVPCVSRLPLVSFYRNGSCVCLVCVPAPPGVFEPIRTERPDDFGLGQLLGREGSDAKTLLLLALSSSLLASTRAAHKGSSAAA